MSLAQSTKKHDAGRIPGPANVPNVLEFQIIWTGANGRTFRSNVHGASGGAVIPSVAVANTFFSAVSTAWTSNLASFAPTASNMFAATVRDMTSAANPIFQSTAAAAPGTSVSAAMPEGVALVLTENLNIRGRGAKGRIYVPNWAVNADTGLGVATAGVQTAMNAFGTAIFNAISAASLTPCVAKPARAAYIGYSGASHPARQAGNATVSNFTCIDLRWDYQRRRTAP